MAKEELLASKRPIVPARRRRWLSWLVYSAALVSVAYVGTIVFLVDVVWPATVLGFLPRWMPAIPVSLIALTCLLLREKKLFAFSLASLLALVVFVCDLQVPSFSCGGGKESAKIRLLTQNAMSVPLSGAWLADVVKREDLDLVLVQECKSDDLGGKSPLPGYELAVDYNTCLLTRFHVANQDIRDRKDVWEKGGSGALALYELQAPFGTFYVLNLHLETVRAGLGGFKRFGLGGIATMRESAEIRAWEAKLAEEWAARSKGPLIVAGDFNTPRESQLFRRAWTKYDSAFDTCGWGFGYTKETVVKHIEFGTRIDHVLFDDAFRCADAHLTPSIGSDHRGLVAELRMK